MRGGIKINQKFGGQTIASVVKKNLCTGCGTCVSICPLEAVSLITDANKEIYLPKVDISKCNNCFLCYRVCPGETVNFKQLRQNIHKPPIEQPDSVLLGSYADCYVGYSTDTLVRYNSASGGIISQLLISALETGSIDGALITRMNKNKPLEPEPFIARSRQEILEAAKSKYCPVPLNVALKEILLNEGRYAYVGLPCHVHGLRKAQQLNQKLFKRIVLVIGIFCSHNDTFGSTRYMLHRLKVSPSDVAAINYRGQGWPGTFNVQLKSGGIEECDYLDWIKVHEHCFFTPDRCLLCCDHTAELADISTGDSWLPQFYIDRVGTSLTISRNRAGNKYLKLAISRNQIAFARITSESIVKSQGNVRFKKNGYPVRRFIFRLQRKSVPTYDVDFPNSGLVEIPRSLIIFLNRALVSKISSSQTVGRLIYLQSGLKKLYAKSTFSTH